MQGILIVEDNQKAEICEIILKENELAFSHALLVILLIN